MFKLKIDSYCSAMKCDNLDMCDSYKDREIKGIDHLEVITNGTVDEIRNSVTNPNQIGCVIDNKTNKSVSQITPVIMIINQGLSDLHCRIDALLQNGADLNMKIDYYGTQRSANEEYQMRKV